MGSNIGVLDEYAAAARTLARQLVSRQCTLVYGGAKVGLMGVLADEVLRGGGQAIGATDDFGFAAVENKLHVHDVHANMLHLMGLDHEKLTYFHAGREHRLTDVSGRILPELVGG